MWQAASNAVPSLQVVLCSARSMHMRFGWYQLASAGGRTHHCWAGNPAERDLHLLADSRRFSTNPRVQACWTE